MPKKKQSDMAMRVMKEIHQKGVKMRPKIYFVLGSLLLGVGLAAALILAIFFINLVLFGQRLNQPFAFLWLGRMGLKAFFHHFPWWPFLLAIGGLASGLTLLRRYDISYKKSFLGLIFGLVVMVLTFGFLLDRIGFNKRAEKLKMMRPFYPRQLVGKDWLSGEVIQVKDREIEIVTLGAEKVKIVWDETTRFPFGRDFRVGERISAVGGRENGVFAAKGVLQLKGIRPRPAIKGWRYRWRLRR